MKQIENILLINPSVEILEDSLRRITTPLGLLYIGTALKQRGYKVKLVNSPCEGYDNLKKVGSGRVLYGLDDEEILRKIKDYNPDLVE